MIGYIIVFGVMILVVGFISWRWVVGIDYMKENHPDYKGDDLFGVWDDDKAHTEGEI
jgi:hypothetical protein